MVSASHNPVGVLADASGLSPEALAADVVAALDRDGSWERFFEVRVGAGPTVRVRRMDDDPSHLDVSAVWGTQRASARTRSKDLVLAVTDVEAQGFLVPVRGHRSRDHNGARHDAVLLRNLIGGVRCTYGMAM